MPFESLFSSGLQALFYIVTLVFVIFSVTVAYHWFAYGSSKAISMLSLSVYLIVSAPLFITMAILLTIL